MTIIDETVSRHSCAKSQKRDLAFQRLSSSSQSSDKKAPKLDLFVPHFPHVFAASFQVEKPQARPQFETKNVGFT